MCNQIEPGFLLSPFRESISFIQNRDFNGNVLSGIWVLAERDSFLIAWGPSRDTDRF
jgi:hypothetical protein